MYQQSSSERFVLACLNTLDHFNYSWTPYQFLPYNKIKIFLYCNGTILTC